MKPSEWRKLSQVRCRTPEVEKYLPRPYNQYIGYNTTSRGRAVVVPVFDVAVYAGPKGMCLGNLLDVAKVMRLN